MENLEMLGDDSIGAFLRSQEGCDVVSRGSLLSFHWGFMYCCH